MTVAVPFAVNPPVSSTSTVTLSLPGTANWCCAMASCDHGVSQTPSFSQSHRTWSRLGGALAPNEGDGNVETAAESPLARGPPQVPSRGGFLRRRRGGGGESHLSHP